MARFGDAAGGGLHLQVQVSVSKRGIREQSTVTLCSWEIQSELDSPHAAMDVPAGSWGWFGS